jgi:UDP-N-acetyl-D-mannosaminuronate dehydrogenase
MTKHPCNISVIGPGYAGRPVAVANDARGSAGIVLDVKRKLGRASKPEGIDL